MSVGLRGDARDGPRRLPQQPGTHSLMMLSVNELYLGLDSSRLTPTWALVLQRRCGCGTVAPGMCVRRLATRSAWPVLLLQGAAHLRTCPPRTHTSSPSERLSGSSTRCLGTPACAMQATARAQRSDTRTHTSPRTRETNPHNETRCCTAVARCGVAHLA